MAEDEMVGWHHQLDGHEFEQALGIGDGQGHLACCSPWGRRVRRDWGTELNWQCNIILALLFPSGYNVRFFFFFFYQAVWSTFLVRGNSDDIWVYTSELKKKVSPQMILFTKLFFTSPLKSSLQWLVTKTPQWEKWRQRGNRIKWTMGRA